MALSCGERRRTLSWKGLDPFSRPPAPAALDVTAVYYFEVSAACAATHN